MSFGAPCVAHRVWAIPTDPSRTDFDTRFSSTETFPVFFMVLIRPFFINDIPAESYPLYSSLFKPFNNIGAAFLDPIYATIPHIFYISLSLLII